jgi:micrococcal nuclease
VSLSRAVLVLAVLAAVVVARLLASAGEDQPTPAGERTAAVVVRTVDGDTLRVRTSARREETVRLLGIDTPETRRPDTPVECGGPEASAAMARLAPRDSRVTLVGDPTQDRKDRYGRVLAHVFLADGRLVEEELLRSGWATVYVFRGNPVQRIAAFRRAAREAKAARRGVWARCGGAFHGAALG